MVLKVSIVILRHVKNEQQYAHWQKAVQSVQKHLISNENIVYSITILDDYSTYKPSETIANIPVIENKLHRGLAELLPFVYFSNGQIDGDAMLFLHDTMYLTAPLDLLHVADDVKPIYSFKLAICPVSLSNGVHLLTPDCAKMNKKDYPAIGFFGSSVYITQNGVQKIKPFVEHYLTNANKFCERKYRIGLERALAIESKFRGLKIGKSFCGDVCFDYPGGFPCLKPPAPKMVGKLYLGREQ